MAKSKLTKEQVREWLAEQDENELSELEQLAVTAKADALQRKLQPKKTKLLELWEQVKELTKEIEAIDASFSGPWNKNPQEIYNAINALLRNKPAKSLDELAAALPRFSKDKLKKRLDKGTTGKRVVYVLDGAGKYSLKK